MYGGSGALPPPSPGGALPPPSPAEQVMGLRERLLREAQMGRQRSSGSAEVGTQTDPVVILDSSSASSALATVPVGGPSAAHNVGWDADDDLAQAEALRTIALLGERNNHFRHSEGRITELEAQLRAESASRQELDAQLSHERSRKEAAQQQVLCLEYELDGKEASLQVAERALERRDADLQQAELQVRALQDSVAASAMPIGTSSGLGDDGRYHALRAQLSERERQLELKDQHIARLLNVLRQHRGIMDAEDSAICGSDRSAPLTFATLAAV